jgi:hypothetical protein
VLCQLPSEIADIEFRLYFFKAIGNVGIGVERVKDRKVVDVLHLVPPELDADIPAVMQVLERFMFELQGDLGQLHVELERVADCKSSPYFFLNTFLVQLPLLLDVLSLIALIPADLLLQGIPFLELLEAGGDILQILEEGVRDTGEGLFSPGWRLAAEHVGALEGSVPQAL